MMRYKLIMYELLKEMRTLPLKPSEVGDFLCVAAKLAMVDVITADDWKYLARLVVFRIKKYALDEWKGDR